eukprot:TRINITY_DN7083_c0_g1_i2.p1 TRINITY_DN7083_c0_g1~~TRINITY_DN7083_c0_g1_i2.p1  ORF type:complete len:928 (+),score=193.23 TRINITY_DN7083_c0_g1_i2:37-2784(+)
MAGRRQTILIYSTDQDRDISSMFDYEMDYEEEETSQTNDHPDVPDRAEIIPHALAKQTNLMYSDREIEEMTAILAFIVKKAPKVLGEYFLRIEKRDYDELSKCLINLSFGNDCTFDLLRYFIVEEFENNIPEQIMRENVPGSKLVKAYLNRMGEEYLQDILRDFIGQIVHDRKVSFEMDPSKTDEVYLEKNKAALVERLNEILDIITSNVNSIPVGFRVISQIVADMTEKIIGPDQVHTMIGSFLFLRFINPAIFSPDVYGLIPKGKSISSTTRRNLILITKVIQNLSNGKTFSMKEQYMHPFDSFILENKEKMGEFFDNVIDININVESIHSDCDIIISVRDLHVFHSLLFQYQSEVSHLFSEEDAQEFVRRLESLGSYENKISFSFLDENQQKYVTQVLDDQEASYIGLAKLNNAKKKKKNVALIVVVGMNRLIFIKGSNGKIYDQFHLLSLEAIISNSPTELELVFRAGQSISMNIENADNVINSIRRSFSYHFPGIPRNRNFNLDVQPSSRLLNMTLPSNSEVCGGLTITYKCLCNYYESSEYHPNISWDISNLYHNNHTFDLTDFTEKEENPLALIDTVPLFHALAYNRYFTTIKISNIKFDKTSWNSIIELFSCNSTLENIVLTHITFSQNARTYWSSLFEALRDNISISFRSFDLSNNSIEDKVLSGFAEFLQTTNSPITSIDLSYNCGDKVSSDGGLDAILEVISTVPKFKQMQYLNLEGNRLTDIEGSLSRYLEVQEDLEYLNISSRKLDNLNIIFCTVINKPTNLKQVIISNCKLPSFEEWEALLEFLVSPNSQNLELLDISGSQVPTEVFINILKSSREELYIDAKGNNLEAPFFAEHLFNMRARGLDISSNNFSEDDLTLIFQNLRNNVHLEELVISDNFRSTNARIRSSLIDSLCSLVLHIN